MKNINAILIIINPLFGALFGAISSAPLQSCVLKMFFSKPQKELPLVALFGQEKIHFSPQGFSFRSGLGSEFAKSEIASKTQFLLYHVFYSFRSDRNKAQILK